MQILEKLVQLLFRKLELRKKLSAGHRTLPMQTCYWKAQSRKSMLSARAKTHRVLIRNNGWRCSVAKLPEVKR